MKISATLLALLCIAAFAQQKGTFTDTRDGKIYKTVKIGEQVWMAENLNYEAPWSKCYNDSIFYCDKYGRLYDWAAAMSLLFSCNSSTCSSHVNTKHKGICPKGWHLPSDAEWDKLLLYVDGDKSTESPHSKTAGEYLKSKEGWNDYKGKSGNGEDKFGFSALPGGYSDSGGYFSDAGHIGHWWSASQNSNSRAYGWYMGCYNERAYRSDSGKSLLLSVRCVGD
jgi:uncharacterized protein (TIGR02145 family)